MFSSTAFTMASHQGMLSMALAIVQLALASMISGETLHVRLTSSNTPATPSLSMYKILNTISMIQISNCNCCQAISRCEPDHNKYTPIGNP